VSGIASLVGLVALWTAAALIKGPRRFEDIDPAVDRRFRASRGFPAG
jgi:hypothetical protein